MSRLARLAFALPLLVVVTRAQTPIGSFALPGPFGEVGAEVGAAGDFDGDGAQDALASGPAVAAVYSTATGAQLAAVVLPGTQPLSTLALPDIDGDGQRDLVVADGISARAVSSADGSVLWSQPGSPGGSIGWSSAVLPDVDGDGFDDLAIGEPDADPHGLSSAGSVWVLSGDSGALIRRIDGTAAQQILGISVDVAPDLDRDGRADLFVGDSKFASGGMQVGRVLVVSAFTGATLEALPNNAEDFNFARELANAGDLDGDGLEDVIVGASETGIGSETYSTGTTLKLWSAFFFPSSLAGVGDVNFDGVPDVVVGSASGFFGSSAQVLSGTDGALIQGISNGTYFGFRDIAPLGDTDGDALPELLSTSGGNGFFPAPFSAVHLELPAGGLLHVFQNQVGGDALGSVVDLAGDVDGDGEGDWLVASSRRLAIFSGDDGAALLNVDPDMLGSTAVFAGSAGCALGDADGDGVPDVALGNSVFGGAFFTGDGRVRVLSGADGHSIAVRDGAVGSSDGLGSQVVDTTDHDGDGVRDLYVAVIGADVNGFSNAGQVLLLSGADLHTLATLTGLPQVSGGFGSSLNADADLTGDGVPELAVGSTEEWPGHVNGGSLYILDGATHATLFRKDAADQSSQITGALCGDLDGDDVPDFLAAESQLYASGESQARGRVKAFSGKTGVQLWEQLGPWPGAQFGIGLTGAGDVDGDGFADAGVMGRSQIVSPGTYSLLSGPNGAVLDQVTLPLAVNGNAIGPMRTAGLFDAGGCADVIVGLPNYGGEGGALVFASGLGGVHGFVDLGFAKPGSTATPTLRGYGNLAAGGIVTLKARHALPNKSCSWFFGLSAGYLPFKQGVLVPDPFGFFVVLPLVTDANGEFSITAPNPGSVFAGLSLFHQFWFSDPAASAKLSASNGMQEIFK